jgi:deoxyribodipyrimidine photo-lyase
MLSGSTAIVWFRRDLRISDHAALWRAVGENHRVVPVFILDDALLAGRWPSPNRAWFMARSLRALASSLAERGAPLTLLRGRPATVLPQFSAEIGARSIHVSRDYGPYGRRRDAAVAEAARSRGIAFTEAAGVLVHEPEWIASTSGRHFTVFSPFRRAWEAAPPRSSVPRPVRIEAAHVPATGSDVIWRQLDAFRPTADEALMPAPGEDAARSRLAAWARSAALLDYDSGRDRLDQDGTSRLSQDLRWGLLSPVQVLEAVGESDSQGGDAGRRRFRSEICWRDFYAHLLWHEPRVARESFRSVLEGVAWENDALVIDAWREGRTGYPVVDAAMRQLTATGWMHNRARMITASFLTKHLGVDWRLGEAHFMRHLLDGDVASNNGGWQWAASTGTDPQPYFRIFNPTLQGKRHDPEGRYVRRWLPELAARPDLPGAAVHTPGTRMPPIVDHAQARRRALAAYEARART